MFVEHLLFASTDWKIHSLIFAKDLHVLGNLLGTENIEIKIEIVPVLRSLQCNRSSRCEQTIIHKMHSVSRGHSVGAGRHWAPWACCVGFEWLSRS